MLGTFAVYYQEPRSPTADDLDLVEQISDLAGFAILYDRAEHGRPHRHGARLERVMHFDCPYRLVSGIQSDLRRAGWPRTPLDARSPQREEAQ